MPHPYFSLCSFANTYEELILQVHVIKRLNYGVIVGLDGVVAGSALLCDNLCM
jgi:hypothetical protein